MPYGNCCRSASNTTWICSKRFPVAIYTTDAGGKITYYNQAAADFAGRRPKLGSDEWCVAWRLFWPDGDVHAARRMRHGCDPERGRPRYGDRKPLLSVRMVHGFPSCLIQHRFLTETAGWSGPFVC